jgi:hypothetical protein
MQALHQPIGIVLQREGNLIIVMESDYPPQTELSMGEIGIFYAVPLGSG